MRLIVATVALLITTSIVSAARLPQFDPATMMRSSELQRGMIGYGLSVFQGVEITRFDVEVLGVLSKANLGEDLILIKITSGPVVESKSGIIGGMSGSPVYVGGKLIGAIAYGWGFLHEAIGGVTPIEAMLTPYATKQPEEQARLPEDHPARGAMVAGRWVEEAVIADLGPAFADDDTITLRPASPIITVAGMEDHGMQRLQALFGAHGLQTMPGPGRLDNGTEVELQPGSAIGVQLMQGDFDVSGIGTVTWRNGSHVLAFGHPMMEIGPVNIPVTTAWVHDFLPSLNVSNKLASPMKSVGTLVNDGSWSVAAEVGEQAPMIPATIAVRDEDSGRVNTFNVRVACHELLTSSLLMSALDSALWAGVNVGSKGIASLDFELLGDGGAVIRRHDTIWHPASFMPVVSWVDEALYYLTENRFTPQQPRSLNVSVSLRDEEKLAAIERVYTDQSVARAGEDLTVHVVMRPDGGERFEKTVTFTMPRDLPRGTLRLGAVAGGDEYSLKSYLRLLSPQMDSLEDIAKLIESMKRSDQLYIAAAIPEIVIGMEGQELPATPASIVSILAEDMQSDLTAGYTEVSETLDSDYYLYGLQTLRLPTEDRNGERGTVRATDDERGSAATSVRVGDRSLERIWWAASAIDPNVRPMQANGLPEPDLGKGEPEGGDEAVEDDGDADLAADAGDEEDTAGDEDADADEDEDASGEHPEPDGEALARGLKSLTHASADEFEEGELHGTMVRSDGAVVLAPRAEMIARLPEPSAWSVAADGDGVWVGTANPGRVYHWTPGSEARALCDTGSMLVLSLLPMGDGTVLAGTAPGGRVLHIAADGKIVQEWKLDAAWVWSLERDGSTIVAGTGPDGAIYRVDGDRAEFFTRISQPHVFDLLYANGALYAAGGEKQGGVFEIASGGSIRDIFGTDESSCTGIACGEDGRLIVSTAEDGKLYVIEPDGGHVEAYESDGNIMSVASDGTHAWAATTDEGRIISLDERNRTAVAHQDMTSDQVVRVSAGTGAVYAVTASPTNVWRLDTSSVAEGTFVSEPLDAERMSRWVQMDWNATVPEGTLLQIDARTGNGAVADESWSAWTGDLVKWEGRVGVPDARYLQYRLRLAGRPLDDLEVRRLEALYLPRNQKPTLEVGDPAPGAAIRNKYELSWTAKDKDDDTLLMTIQRRASGGGEWVEVTTLSGEDSYKWDTGAVDGGLYDLRFLVSDEPSNPSGALTEEVVVEGVLIDNGYPKLILVNQPGKGDGERLVSGIAVDDLSRITSVDWSFCGKELWRSALPEDGLLDSRRERFRIELPEPPEGEYSMQIRIRDAAGNVTVETIPLDGKPATTDADTAPIELDAEGAQG